MKMLLSTAQTLPLYVGKSPGAKAPPLCGAVPAELTYVAKVNALFVNLVTSHEMGNNYLYVDG